MKKMDLVSITISLVIGLIAFFVSNNIFVCIGVTLIYVLYYFVLARKIIKTYNLKTIKIKSCLYFINTFLITLSIKDSLEDAFEHASNNTDKEFQQLIYEMQEMNVNEKLDYLKKYYSYSSYRMFTKVISLYLDQGGNVLKISESLLNEVVRIDETMNESKSSSKKKLVEFVILWLLTFLVLLFMRFALSEFYFSMLKSIPFFALLIVFFLLCLVSLHVFLKRFTKLPVNEEGELNG